MERIQYQTAAAQRGASNQLYDEVNGIIGRYGADPLQAKGIGEKLIENYKQFDDKYISALLFPEDSEAARIPTKFPLATANATQTFSFYLNTGDNGTGYAAVLPLDLSYCLAYKSMPDYDGNPSDSGAYRHIYMNDTSCSNIIDYYAQGRVVGCSVRCQYIGEAMAESGLLVGAHVYDSTLGHISENVVENGYYISRGRPHEGIRLAYLPRDDGDLEYTGLDYRIQRIDNATPPPEQVVKPSADYGWDGSMDTGEIAIHVKDPATQTFVRDVGRTTGSSAANGFVITRRTDQLIGQGNKRFQSNTPYQMVIYWVGMPPNKNWLRIDITRHLELIPRLLLRDLISVKKAEPDDHTMKAICQVAEVDSRPLSNTLARHEEAVAAGANAPVDKSQMVSKGVRTKGTQGWLSKIWGGLQSIMGLAAPVVGMMGPYGRVAGTAMGLLGGQPSMQSDSYSGRVNSGLYTGGP